MLKVGARVVGYTRVSTASQAKAGLSLDAQEATIRAYALAKGYDLVEVITDRGKSAKSLRRPGVKRVLALLDAGDVAGVLVTKLDRLTRRVRDAATLFDDYFPAGRDLHLVTTSEFIDTKSVGGRFVAFVLAAAAQLEREQTEDRNVAIVTHQRRKGKQLGHVPFGYGLGDDGATLVPCPEDLQTLAMILGWADAGRSTRQIAAGLTELGRPTKRGRGAWAHSTVAEILRADRRANPTRPDPNLKFESSTPFSLPYLDQSEPNGTKPC